MESQLSKRAIWSRHVREGSGYPDGIAAYCRDRGLRVASFHYWRRRFQIFTKPRSAALSPFVAVSVDKLEEGQLPDPKWLGLFAAHLIRGLR